MFGRFKRCCGRYFLHTYGDWYRIPDKPKCYQQKHCVFCGIKKFREKHVWGNKRNDPDDCCCILYDCLELNCGAIGADYVSDR